MNKLQAVSLKPQIDLNALHQSLTTTRSESVKFIGQKRAQQALEFGLGIDAPGYNLYVMGEPALGRYTMVMSLLKEVAKRKETPQEWCFLNNFDDSRRPSAIRFAPEQSKVFHDDMSSLLDEVLDTFPAAFDNPGYQRQRKALDQEFNNKYATAMEDIQHKAMTHGVMLFEESNTVTFSPIVDGKAIEDADFAVLTEEQRNHFYDVVAQLEALLNERLLELPKWKRELSEKRRELKKSTIETIISPRVKDLEHKYRADLGVLKHLKSLREELVESIFDWLSEESPEAEAKEEIDKRAVLEDQFLPNPIVQFKVDDGAPIIYEPNPTYCNLFGRTEYSSLQNSVYTSYRMIYSGALHRANGGYLVLDAEKMLTQPNVWESLKRALKSNELRMELPNQEGSIQNATILEPQEIPLNVKVILMGSRELYYTIQELDDEFNELFRILADFEHSIPVSQSTMHQFISKVVEHVEKLDVEGISESAIACLLQFSYRQAEHQHKLSARFADVLELLYEAAYYAEQDGENLIDKQQIEEALEGRKFRSGRVSESFLEDIKEGQVLIETDGESVGKVNGLTVLEVGDTVFGTPARISATVYAGANGVVDIEREVDLGKAIHSKGVMLLTGYLGHKYAQDFCLTLSANIAIEQSYGHIDGDSASLGELCALISAISHIPLKQSFAITGSINQHGEVQSIGGVNEKIEGFFDLCKARGLTGEQGVIIPAANEVNLVLRDDVIAAVEAGKFHIHSVAYVDEAVELLTGLKAGELSKRHTYPKKSVNYLAVTSLKALARVVNGEDDG